MPVRPLSDFRRVGRAGAEGAACCLTTLGEPAVLILAGLAGLGAENFLDFRRDFGDI